MKTMFKKFIVVLLIINCLMITACVPQTQQKQAIPESRYDKIGYALYGKKTDDGTIIITYTMLGIKDGKIEDLYLDQIENNPLKDKHTCTNKELENGYGLLYKSDHGEWNEQVKALENYIAGNKLTIDEVNEIPTYKKDSSHLMVPQKGTDLEAACELDIKDFIFVINKAYDNSVNCNGEKIIVGENIHTSMNNNSITATITFIGLDYKNYITFSKVEKYSVLNSDYGDIKPLSENPLNDSSAATECKGFDAFGNYILGHHIYDVYSVETYDPGDGVHIALPKPGTDLAEVCSIDLYDVIYSIKEAYERLQRNI